MQDRPYPVCVELSARSGLNPPPGVPVGLSLMSANRSAIKASDDCLTNIRYMERYAALSSTLSCQQSNYHSTGTQPPNHRPRHTRPCGFRYGPAVHSGLRGFSVFSAMVRLNAGSEDPRHYLGSGLSAVNGVRKRRHRPSLPPANITENVLSQDSETRSNNLLLAFPG
jgi:hypothetical protein